MWKKKLPNLNDADNVCDCAEEAERRKRVAAGQGQVTEERGGRTYLSGGNLSNAWLPILGISALVLSLFGLWYKMLSKKKCRQPASTGPFWGGAHNVVKAEENSSEVPLCPCEVKLNAKKRKWPLHDTKK